MDDLIRRADAIEVLEAEIRCTDRGEDVSGLTLAKSLIDALPSADAEWIPCSERLPKKYELVLATAYGDVDTAWRNGYGGWESAEYMYKEGEVIAWMPLPTPYKGGDDE